MKTKRDLYHVFPVLSSVLTQHCCPLRTLPSTPLPHCVIALLNKDKVKLTCRINVLNRSHSQRFICMPFLFILYCLISFSVCLSLSLSQLKPGDFRISIIIVQVSIFLMFRFPLILPILSNESRILECFCELACPLQPCWCECCMYRRCI